MLTDTDVWSEPDWLTDPHLDLSPKYYFRILVISITQETTPGLQCFMNLLRFLDFPREQSNNPAAYGMLLQSSHLWRLSSGLGRIRVTCLQWRMDLEGWYRTASLFDSLWHFLSLPFPFFSACSNFLTSIMPGNPHFLLTKTTYSTKAQLSSHSSLLVFPFCYTSN